MKTRKALVKRFKVTKTGKILRKIGGQNHYRSKKSGKVIRQKRKMIEAPKALAKKLRKAGLK
ncbi:50S ribosomal protein L35 [bacterium (Candidatus Gribaldobacteria) CG_4_10_14_0_2_um_filter_41_16]|uniref:50S ribosomal protein L35 n=3 Tax=Candidatus Gribaldobacteria TaxID=2798536 RepID=A0A2M7VHS8_9BACT|nr:MAG: 50S ribosomal protein L35 [bacterium (Candidatus Gribaldobacteria) CG10_big_fil_rev_8_21_14_0_10_41_12]PIX03450.1 MAG: 50S ribosomal protein L35 [bacterium (Candidatus Gribaldobacteria) CG_4_8_14_3_um_filter_42_11]PJA01363.1 MAG: 50S ribosomal protein L35 [bacterium (Candidatus Gribaldobacteria) CG_4_10_14_0_2_um_filter_41_16]